MPSSTAPARPVRGHSSRRGRGGGPQPYDFRRPTKLSREHARSLQIAYETFARQYATLLTSSLRVVCHVSLVSIEQMSYEEYVSALGNPTIMAMMALDPLPGTAIFELSLSTAMTWVDHLLGGGGGPQPTRPLSDIEAELVRGVLRRALGELRYAFESLLPIQPQLGALEYNPQFAQVCGASDVVVVASFDLRVGTQECVATICLPFNMILPPLEAAADNNSHSELQRVIRATAARAVATGLESTPVEVSVRFAPVRMRSEQIIGLQVTDVVRLRQPVTAALAVTAGDVTFAHAVPGNQRTRLACLIVDSPAAEDPA
ncbi:MAG: flagellar motor switch protein FliM [Pseudonocardiales bacterium]|nr:MAG: flagellar motor switch protein FliM [Pseudonocardiales bacterium]